MTMGLLRYLLAIAVVIDHSGGITYSTLITGTLPVQAFFLISGFYMSLILNEKYNSYSLFITNRLLRLFPIYWLFFFVSLVFSYPFLLLLVVSPYPTYMAILPKFSDFGAMNSILVTFSNLFAIGQDVFLFLGFDKNQNIFYFLPDFRKAETPGIDFLILKQTWSISLELMFYFVAPLLSKRSFLVLFLIFILSIFCRLMLYFNDLSLDPWNYRFFPNELALFVCGFFSYKIYRSNFFTYITDRQTDRQTDRLLLGSSIFLILSTILIGYVVRLEHNLIATIFYISILTVLLPFILTFTKKNRFDNFIGELSYPIYLSHLLTLKFLNILYKAESYAIVNVLLSTIVSILVVYLFKPIEKYRQKRIPK